MLLKKAEQDDRTVPLSVCLIFPVQCITAGPDYTVSQVTYLISDT